MEIIIPYSVFIFITVMGVVQILISNSVVKQTAGSKKYDATNAGRSARRIGYALIIMGVGLIILWSMGNASNGAIYKWTSIVAGIFVGIVGIYNAYVVSKLVNASHPLKEGKNAGHLTIAILQILFGIIAIVCGIMN